MFYLDLFRTLNEEGIRYLVVGGVAVNLHGVVRFTMDIDVSTDPDANQSAAWERACDRLGLTPMRPVRFDQMYDPAERRRLREEKNLIAFGLISRNPEDPIVDVLFEQPSPFAPAYERRMVKESEGVRIPLIAMQDLVAMKRVAGRAKDLIDLEKLRELGP
jgi:hypothetical protein